MRFIRFIRFDIRNGIWKQKKFYLLFMALFLLFCLDYTAKISSYHLDAKSTYGDYFLFVFGGMKEYIPDPTEPFQIPFRWLLNYILILYYTSHYMLRDLTGFGQHILYRSKDRFVWWVSKCVWNAVYVTSFYIFAWMIILGTAICNNAQPTFEFSQNIFYLVDLGGNAQIHMNRNIMFEVTFLPLIITQALSLMQMMLSLLVKPIFCYIINVIIILSSAYYLSSLLIGNYTMAVRSIKIVNNGVSAFPGVVLSVFIILVSIIAGAFIFKKYDILNKEM